MQKVEGSSPFSRFFGLFAFSQRRVCDDPHTLRCSVRTDATAIGF